MQNFFYISLFIFGSLFGSFSSVLIYRLKSGESGILNGRSHCAKCNHILESLQLVPIVSWLKNLGKCHYCKDKISGIYPILELSTGFLFALIGYFLIDFNLILEANLIEISKLLFWLVIGFISILYTFYDILFLEIHEGIMLSGISLAFIYLSINTFLTNSLLISISSIILSGTIIGALYVVMLKELKEKWDILIILGSIGALYIFKISIGINLTDIIIIDGLIAALVIFIFFFLQILLSGGRALGGGDLRIALMVGLLLGTSFVLPGLMFTYIVGSVIGIYILAHSRIKNKGTKMTTQVPFGPFIAIGFFITLFYSTDIANLINIYF